MLDKNIKTKELNLKEGDTILVSFEAINNIEKVQNSQNGSTINLIEDINQEDNHIEPLNTNRKKNYLLYILTALIIIGLGIFLLCYFLLKPSKKRVHPINDNRNNDDGNDNNSNNKNSDKYET